MIEIHEHGHIITAERQDFPVTRTSKTTVSGRVDDFTYSFLVGGYGSEMEVIGYTCLALFIIGYLVTKMPHIGIWGLWFGLYGEILAVLKKPAKDVILLADMRNIAISEAIIDVAAPIMTWGMLLGFLPCLVVTICLLTDDLERIESQPHTD